MERRGQYLTLTGVDDDTELPFVTRAFLPSSLPPALTLTMDTWTVVAAAHEALGRLGEHLRRDPRGARLLLAVEAAASHRLAGATVTVTDVLRATDGRPATVSAVPVVLASSARDAGDLLDTAMTALGTGVRHGHAWIGARGAGIGTSTYVAPPPGPGLTDGLEAWAAWSRASHLPDVVLAAVSHAQLEALRPAARDNGLLTRLVLVAQVTHALPLGALPLSAVLLRDPSGYEDALATARCEAPFDELVTFVASAVRLAADKARERLRLLTTTADAAVAHLSDAGLRGTVVTIAAGLADRPVGTVGDLATHHDVAFQTANVAVERLVEHGVLAQLTEGHYDRVFGAPRVLDLLSLDPRVVGRHRTPSASDHSGGWTASNPVHS